MLTGPDHLDPELFEYLPRFLSSNEANVLLATLWRELDWSQREITLFGRRVMQPRLVAWYGDAGAVYRYSGLEWTPLPWHPVLSDLKVRLERAGRCRFNAVLANAYRDGRDSMGWHSDDEKELGDEPVIASLSLGATRRFLLRPRRRNTDSPGSTIALPLDHGSLLLMRGLAQQRFQHALPRTRRPVELRINLTYRLVDVQALV